MTIRIVLGDDDKNFRRVTALALEKTGYEVEQRPVSYGSSRWHVVMLNHPLPPFLCFRLDHPLKRAFRMRPIRLAG